MNTFSIDELDREEIEFLPPRVVMTTCNPRPCPPAPCAPVQHCEPVYCAPAPCPPPCDVVAIEIGVKVRLGGLLRL